MPAASGEAILVGGADVGRVTTVAGDQALGYVHRKVTDDAEATIGGVLATLRPLEIHA